VPPEKALDILQKEVQMKQLDTDLVSVFIDAKIWQKKPETKGS
jgi:hypothetical protein